MVWSTAIINFIKENNIPTGFFTQSPYWKLDENIRKDSILFNYTDEEITTLVSIKNDVFNLIPFLNIKLRDYQEDLLNKVSNNRYNLVLKSRQCGIDTVNAISILHYILTNEDKNILVLVNNIQQGCELIDKVKKLYYSLPFYMKIGVETWNQSSIKFSNGVRLKVGAGKNAAIGTQIHYLLICDAAHIVNFFEIYRSLFPMVSSLKDSKITISSTPNGINDFYHIYKDASLNKNSYALTKVYWHQVDGRDEQWKKDAILSIGSLNHFEQEYELKFHGEITQAENKTLEQINDVVSELKNNINIKSVKKLSKLVKELKKSIK